jgi:hypothetical protein
MSSTTANSTPPQDLYIALFARTSTPRTYHWALLVCSPTSPPTATSGVRYHVTNSIQGPTPETPNPPQPNPDGRLPWRFEAQPLANLFTASPLLARVLVSQIANPALVSATLEAVPLIQDDKTWTCRMWVRDALATLAQLGIIELPSHLPTSPVAPTPSGRLSLTDVSWAAIETASLAYLESKHTVHRWRDASEGMWVEGEVPTWDLREEREVVA